jgi:hydrogenase expression/formation protein HypC
MCLAIPARLVELRENDQAVVDLGGIRKEISIALVDGVQVGDYVIVHVGHAIGTLDPEEAERTLALFAEMAAMNATDAMNATVATEPLSEAEATP